MFAVKFLLLSTVALIVDCSSDSKASNNCAAIYLKDNGILEEDFPVFDIFMCRLIVPIALRAFEKSICIKLSEHESIAAECVVKELRKANAFDYMLKEEAIVMAKALDEETAKRLVKNIRETLRMIFEQAALTCDSDPRYAGVFDDLFEIRNESLAVLQQNYCFTKFVVESKLIEVQNVDFNPKRIVTTNIDCLTLIKKNRATREKKFLNTMKSQNVTEDQMQCIMDKYQIHRASDSNLALEVIDQIEVPLSVRRTNREIISKRLEPFMTSIFMCSILKYVQNRPISIIET